LAATLTYNFDGSDVGPAWTNVDLDPANTNGPQKFDIGDPDGGTSGVLPYTNPNFVYPDAPTYGPNYPQNNAGPTILYKSPAFHLDGSGNLTAWLTGGTGDTSTSPTNINTLSLDTHDSPNGVVGYLGIALVNNSTGAIVQWGTKTSDGQGGPSDSGAWQEVTFTAASLSADVGSGSYSLDLIRNASGSWGWVGLDDVSIPGVLVTPEPSSIVALVGLCGMGLIGLSLYRRRLPGRASAARSLFAVSLLGLRGAFGALTRRSITTCALACFAVAALSSGARAALITAVFPTSHGQPVNLDAPNEGFVKIGTDGGNPNAQVNTSAGVISAISHVGSFAGVQETGNTANYFQFQSLAQSINDNNGDNTGNFGGNNTGEGYTFTIANNSLAQTVNVYVGEYNATSMLTVTTTNDGSGTASQVGFGNTYLDYVVSLPGGAGTTTISWVQTASLGGADNPSIFAVTASVVPEPSSIVALVGFCGMGMLVLVRRRRAARARQAG
jgi:hypothetical protein